ncbi:MAG TPA: LPS export ABC transporter periplasmic protein LptC [Noviherbaspirillum sp.]|jgi:lipopolysaccharide export system protein LptC|uniref:LPS export ABC transporter periplasmic protein LptC n=1 Tax=Noviherbaspirillum sp. TaxID=1926288 RepID=UPI002F920C50
MKDNGWRLRSITILALLAALALGSFWLFEVIRRGGDDLIPQPERTEPDFYLENFSYVKISKATGKTAYHFSGAKMVHNPKDDSYFITAPVITNKSEGKPPTTLRGDRGIVNSDYSQVNLYDNVRMDRAAGPDSRPMKLRSSHLLILPDEDVVRTDVPVEITVGESTLNGTGMWANNATRELRLSSNVHGTYQAPSP